jgi:hypothetical protein
MLEASRFGRISLFPLEICDGDSVIQENQVAAESG